MLNNLGISCAPSFYGLCGTKDVMFCLIVRRIVEIGFCVKLG